MTKIENHPDFSEVVSRVRRKLGLTPAKFAELVGVTPAAVSLWESGRRQPEGPTLRVLWAIDKQLGERKLPKDKTTEILEGIAIGAAFGAFVVLLAELFSSDR